MRKCIQYNTKMQCKNTYDVEGNRPGVPNNNNKWRDKF